MEVYIDDLIALPREKLGQHHQASELTIQVLKEISPSLPSEVKDSVGLKKHCWATAAGTYQINPRLDHQHSERYLEPPSQMTGGVEYPLGHPPLPKLHVNQKTGADDRKTTLNVLRQPWCCGAFLPPSYGAHGC